MYPAWDTILEGCRVFYKCFLKETNIEILYPGPIFYLVCFQTAMERD